MMNPDYYEVMESQYLVTCDLCKKDALTSETQTLESITYDSVLLICQTCMTKLEKGEPISDDKSI